MYTEGPKNGTGMQLFNNLHRTKNNNIIVYSLKSSFDVYKHL